MAVPDVLDSSYLLFQNIPKSLLQTQTFFLSLHLHHTHLQTTDWNFPFLDHAESPSVRHCVIWWTGCNTATSLNGLLRKETSCDWGKPRVSCAPSHTSTSRTQRRLVLPEFKCTIHFLHKCFFIWMWMHEF